MFSFIQFDLEEDCFLCHLVPEFSKLKVLCVVPPLVKNVIQWCRQT